MWFCPLDGTLLMVGDEKTSQLQPRKNLFCSTCPYSCSMEQNPRMNKSYPVRIKTVDDILGGSAAWENVDRTSAVCPQCHHDTAYFMQIQIRSADEPMTVFYKCVKCSHQWNDK